MIKNLSAALCASSLVLAGCASGAGSISPAYVSPMIYDNYNCDQIREEMRRVGVRVSEVTGQQNRAARNDAIAMGVGLVIFWPALFFLANDNDRRDELSRLMGEHEALQQTGIRKSCFSDEERQAIEDARNAN